MKTRMLLVTSLTAALGLGAASAQTATPATTTVAPANFSDVPAGHWAKDAVDFITQRGLIQGFPDGTFRGNENLTRYQAALIFYRLLQSGQLSQMAPQDMQTVVNGMQEVATELATITGRVDALESANTSQAQRIQTLEQQIAALDTTNITTNTTDLSARVATLEQTVQQLQQNVQTLQAAPAPTAAAPADTSALEARVAALETQVAQQAAQPAPAPAPVTVAPAPAPADQGVAVVPGEGQTVIVDSGVGNAPIFTEPTTYVGISASYAFGSDAFAFNALKYNAVFGLKQFLFGFGARVDVGYQPSNSAIEGDVNLMYGLGAGAAFQPYVGAGAGIVYSTPRVGDGGATDFYVSGLVGVDYRFTDSLGVFAEATPRYYFSNNGLGTNLNTTATNGFGIGARVGLKFFF